MERTQQASERLAAQAAAQVDALWARHVAGDLPLPSFRSLAAAVIVRANAAGVNVGDLGLAAELTRNLGRPVSPLGIRPDAVQVDHARVAAAIDTVLEADPQTATNAVELADSRRLRLSQVARSEPLLTVAATVQSGMISRGIPGWVRQVDADPCPKCVAWADGVVRPASVPMARHNGCACIQQPVLS